MLSSSRVLQVSKFESTAQEALVLGYNNLGDWSFTENPPDWARSHFAKPQPNFSNISRQPQAAVDACGRSSEVARALQLFASMEGPKPRVKVGDISDLGIPW